MSESTSDTLSSDKISSGVSVEHTQAIHTENETWKPVPDWPYEVSNLGHVRRLERKRGAKVGQNRKGGTSGPIGMKYPNMILCRDVDGGIEKKTFLLHQLVALVFLGPTPPGMEIDHKDGDRFNCRADNLEFKTPSQNILGAVERGHRGCNRWNSKLNDDVVRTMRLLYGQGWTIRQVSDHFKANFTTTYHVLMGHNWRHVL